MATFTYASFNDACSEIRLLTIHPGGPDDLVTCSLNSHKLAELPKYEALSYTWGDSTTRNEILVNERKFIAFGNASDALVELRHPTEGRILWVDAICINQQDLDEKKYQILLMRKIYERAIRVVVWFSKPRAQGEEGLAVSLVNELYMQLADKTHTAQSLQQIHVPRLLGAEWVALRDLLAHPWWTRIWTLQEVVVAREIVIQFGRHTIPWDHIRICSDDVRQLNGLFFRKPDEGVHKGHSQPPGCSAISTIEWMRELLQAGHTFSLLEVLLQCWWREATDTRDCIYGLSAICSDLGSDALDITIDYTAPIEDVLTSTVNNILIRYGTLELFCKAGIGFPRCLKGLPSYVPDWSDMNVTAQPLYCHFYNDTQTSPPDENGVSCGADGRLQTKVFFLDNILEVSEPLDSIGGQVVNEKLIQWFDEAEHMAKYGARDPYSTTSPHRSSVPLFEAFWRTLIANRTLQRTSAPDDWFHGYLRYKHTLSQTCGKPTSSLFTDVEEYQDRYNSATDDTAAIMTGWFNMMLITSWGRSFCMTSNGMIGLVPPGAQPGDSICLLQGGEVPFIMRPKIVREPQPVLQLVGESYFHGVSAAEAFTAYRSRGKEPSTVVLV